MLFANVCARFLFSCYGRRFVLGLAFFLGFWASSWRLVHVGSTCLADLPVVYKTWVTQVCLLLDTPFGGIVFQ